MGTTDVYYGLRHLRAVLETFGAFEHDQAALFEC
jgi:hypothetical protein